MRMVKSLFIFALMTWPALGFGADPPSQVGRLNYISGPVSFAPAEANNDWAAATLNRPITTGDRLWADQDGRAEIHIGSTAVRLSALTSVDVLALDDQRMQLRLAQGSVNLRVRRLSGEQTLEIDTPDGAVIVGRPGSYRIDVDPSATATAVTVHRGQADVLGRASSFRIGDGQQATIPGAGGADHDLTGAPAPDEFDRWAAARDRQEDRFASSRYVSDQMTGYEDLDQYGSWRVVGGYGALWVPTVAAGWAPYRYGHWVWISPWGWTWVDDEPWGFAPFHYGRWVWVGGYWAWAPGAVVARPVYAPALVAFVGGAGWSVTVGSAPAVGWVPLGWHEPYIPWYRVSPTYIRHVNVAYVDHVDVTRIYNITLNRDTVTHVRYANRSVPSAVTVVSRETFVSARPVSRGVLKVTPRMLGAAPVVGGAPVAAPTRASLMPARPGHRPPVAAAAREVIGARAPPGHESESRSGANSRGAIVAPAGQEHPPVRVIGPQRGVSPPPHPAERTERERPRQNVSPPAPAAPPRVQPSPARAPRAQPPEQTERRERARENAARPAPPPERRRPEQPPPAVRQAPPAAPADARNRGGNANSGRAESPRGRPPSQAEGRRERAQERGRSARPQGKSDKD